jgi:hypothetical protein
MNDVAPMAEEKVYSIFMDGTAWCATANGFINLQESIAGFGGSPSTALDALIIAENKVEMERWKTIRKWICNNCMHVFQVRHTGDGKTHATGPSCPRCSCGGQYTYELPETECLRHPHSGQGYRNQPCTCPEPTP